MLRQPDRGILLSHLAKTDYFISERVGVVDGEMIQAASNLKLILRLGSLTYDIDTEAAKAAGVPVCYWPVLSVIRVAEHMMMQMLALGKNLRAAEYIALEADPGWRESKRTDENTFAYNWSDLQNVAELWEHTIGIIGFGEIGAELARRLQGWDCRLLYNKRGRLPDFVESELGLTYVDLQTLYAQSDYVVNLLPYFPETDLVINAESFARMKEGAFLVSCGSGSVIDEGALAGAIKSGKVRGAALDTFEWEPIKADNPLLALARANYNVLLTPHIAAGSPSTVDHGRKRDYTNIVNHINGKPLQYRVV
jgi:phosphoglycerate dehydrogenase-like enzyme